MGEGSIALHHEIARVIDMAAPTRLLRVQHRLQERPLRSYRDLPDACHECFRGYCHAPKAVVHTLACFKYDIRSASCDKRHVIAAMQLLPVLIDWISSAALLDRVGVTGTGEFNATPPLRLAIPN
jgi:hypothetical protein